MNALATIIAMVRRKLRLPALWWQRVELRERLGAMPERLLLDIGLDHAAVGREVRKPFWRSFGECLRADAPALTPGRRPGALPMPAVLQPVARLSGATFPMLS